MAAPDMQPTVFTQEPADFSFLHPLRPTLLFTAFWRFTAERQRVFWRRVSSAPPPWTNDPVLAAYKFTNAYRVSDRVSQYLIRSVQYEGPQEPQELFFRTILFKLFNRIETWTLLQREAGPLRTDGFCVERYDRVDKYARVAYPQFTSPDGRHRIKQRFQPSATMLPLWYPPKWGINGWLGWLPCNAQS